MERQRFKLTNEQKQRRRFSDNFKQQKVREIELGLVSVHQLSKLYDVSKPAIYKWIAKFGINTNKEERLIVESKSDTQELIALRKKIAELERLIGQKQIELDFKDKMIALAEQHYGIDIKKNSSTQASQASGKKKKNTPTA